MVVNDTTILVAEHDVSTRLMLTRVLSSNGYEVITAETAEEALRLASSRSPHLVVLARGLGLDLCRALRLRTQVPIVILSDQPHSTDRVAALEAGADDCVTRPFASTELLARIRSRLRRAHSQAASISVLERDGLRIDLAQRRVFRDDIEVRLTRTEFELLSYLMHRPGRIVTHAMIMSAIWGEECGEDCQALRAHIRRLRRKVEPDSESPRFILTELGVGYRFRSTPAVPTEGG